MTSNFTAFLRPFRAACLFVLLTVCCGGCSDSGSVDETPPADQLALSPSSLVFDEQDPAKNEFTVTVTDGLTWVLQVKPSAAGCKFSASSGRGSGSFRVDKRLINPENLQQRVTQLLDEFLGSKSGYEGVKLFAMTITPLRKTILKSIALLTEINILVNDITYSIQFTLQRIVTFARRMVAKEIITKRRAHFPIGVKLIYIMFGQATMKVGIDILQNLRIGSKYIARNIEIVIVTLNLLHRHKARIMRHIALCLPHIDNATNILLSQTILGSIFDISTFGIDHKHSLTP